MPKYAAIDIGSNSIRLLAAEVLPDGPPVALVSERQVTRLGESVFRTGRISAEAQETACAVLSRMAAAYKQLGVAAVRVVATSAVRDAGNQQAFLEKAGQAAEAPVEIISGQEEARLIHLGVQSRWPHPRQRILIADVGGGSAEVISSDAGSISYAISKPLGAVRLTEVFLKNDPPLPVELHRMNEYIEEKLAAGVRRIGTEGFDRVIATSASAAATICAVNRVARSKRDAADRLRATTPQVRRLFRELSVRGLEARRKVPGIGPRRAEIILAGVAVFLRVLEEFQRPSMYYSSAGLRDGIVADLAQRGVGRDLARLDRQQRKAVEDMARRCGVPLAHARKVAALTQGIFESLQPLHKLPAAYGKLLEAAAYLHDVGHFVSDTGHHKHSAYLVANSDMPGFTVEERLLISMLCRYHRKSLPGPRHDNFQSLGEDHKRAILLLTPLLRLADNLDRAHEQRVERLECQLRNGGIVIHIFSSRDTDLEQWAGERAGAAFAEIYKLPLIVRRGRK